MCRKYLGFYAHKKSVALFRLHRIPEVLDNLNLPITTSKAHASRRERRCFTLGDFLKVSKFQGSSVQATSLFSILWCA